MIEWTRASSASERVRVGRHSPFGDKRQGTTAAAAAAAAATAAVAEEAATAMRSPDR